MDLFIYLLVGLPLNLLLLYVIFDAVNGDNKWNTSYYYFRDMVELELEIQQVVEESIACDYGKQFICPNCGEPFDGHECENCKYTEERWKDSNLYLKECYYM